MEELCTIVLGVLIALVIFSIDYCISCLWLESAGFKEFGNSIFQ